MQDGDKNDGDPSGGEVGLDATTNGERAPAPVAGKSVAREYLEALLIAGIFLGFSNTFLVKTFYIPSGSMKPTLLIGDHLFVNRYIYGPDGGPLAALTPAREPVRGDIVVFRSPREPETDLVKRLIGIPGDRIEIVLKELYLNGELVDDSAYVQHVDQLTYPDVPYVSPEARRRDNFGPFVVPEDHYFFLGDNRDESYDSRFWGSVPRQYIKGRALMIYWSNGGPTPDGTWPGWRERIAQIGRTTAGFFTNTRWERSFDIVR